MVLPAAFCSPHVDCCLTSAILAKTTEKIFVQVLPLWTSMYKDGLVSNLLLLQRSLCFRINGHAHRERQHSRIVWHGGVTNYDRLRQATRRSIVRTRQAHINGVTYRCCCAAELRRCDLLVWCDIIYEAYQREHEFNDRLSTIK